MSSPERGVSLAVLVTLRDRARKQGFTVEASCWEFARTYVAPATLDKAASWLSCVASQKDVGKADFYVCYRSAASFSQTVDTLCNHLQGQDPASVFLWIDFLCINLHPKSKELLVSPFTTAAEAMTKAQAVLVLMDREGECLQRGWMVWEMWQAASTRGSQALHWITPPGCHMRDVAYVAQRLDLATAQYSRQADAVTLKEWMEAQHGPEALTLATSQLRLLLLLDATDSQLPKLQLAMMGHRMHELGHSSTCGRPVPDPATAAQADQPPARSGKAGWGAGGVTAAGVWAPDQTGTPPPPRYLQWLSLPVGTPKARHLIITGPPGTGKSSICAAFCSSSHPPSAAVFCSQGDMGFSDAIRVVRSIAYQLCMSCAAFKAYLTPTLDPPSVWSVMTAQEAVDTFLTRPLAAMAADMETNTPTNLTTTTTTTTTTANKRPGSPTLSEATPSPSSLPSPVRRSPSPSLGGGNSPVRQRQTRQGSGPVSARQRLLARLPPHGLVILIDAVNEADYGQGTLHNQVVTLLRDFLTSLPPWVRFILTAPPPSPNHPHLSTSLMLLDPAASAPHEMYRLQDVQVFLAKQVVQKLGTVRSALMVAQQLISHARGDLLFARVLTRLVMLGGPLRAPLDEASLPDSLQDAYTQLLRVELPEGVNATPHLLQLLQVLVAAREPLLLGQLCAMGLAAPLHALPALGTLFFIDQHKVHVCHHSVLTWLADHDVAGDFYADRTEGHKIIAKHVLNNALDPKNGCMYSTRHTLAHLAHAGSFKQLESLVQNLGFWEKVHRAGAGVDVLNDLHDLAPHDNALLWDALRWLASVQRVLLLHPGAVWQLASDAPRSCVMHRATLRQPQAKGSSPGPSPVPPSPVPPPLAWRAAEAKLLNPEPAWPALLMQVDLSPQVITSLALPTTPDLHLLATCLKGGNILLWDMDTYRQLAVLRGHVQSADCVRFAEPTGVEGEQLLVSYSAAEMTVRVWCVDSTQEVACASGLSTRGPAAVSELHSQGFLDFPSDNRRFFVRLYLDGRVELMGSEAAAPPKPLPHNEEAPEQTNVSLATLQKQKAVRGTILRRLHHVVTALSLLPPDHAELSGDEQVVVTASGSHLQMWDHKLMNEYAQKDSDELQAIGAQGRVLTMWDHSPALAWLEVCRTNKHQPPQPPQQQQPLTVNPSAHITPLDSDPHTTLDTTLDPPHADTKQSKVPLPNLGHIPAYRPGTTLDTLSSATDPSRSRMPSVLSPRGKLGGVGGLGYATQGPGGGSPAVVAVALTVVGSDAVRVVDGLSGKLLAELDHPPKVQVKCICISPDGVLVATGASDNRIRLWSTAACSQAWVQASSSSSSPTTNAGAVAAADDDDEGGDAVRTLVPPILELQGHVGHVTGLTFLQGSNPYHLVSGSTDESLRVWDISGAHAAALQAALRPPPPQAGPQQSEQKERSPSRSVSPMRASSPARAASPGLPEEEEESAAPPGDAGDIAAATEPAPAAAPAVPPADAKPARKATVAAAAPPQAMAAPPPRSQERLIKHPSLLAQAGRAAMASANILITASVRGRAPAPKPVHVPSNASQLESSRRFDHIPAQITHRLTGDTARRQAELQVAVLDGHEGGVTCITSKGFQVASGASDRCVRLWQCKGRLWYQQALLGTHPGPVTSLAFSRQGDMLASGSCQAGSREDGVVKVWHVASGSLILQVPHYFMASWCSGPQPTPSSTTMQPVPSTTTMQPVPSTTTMQPVPSRTTTTTLPQEYLAVTSHHCIQLLQIPPLSAAAHARSQTQLGSPGAQTVGQVSLEGVEGQGAHVANVYSMQPIQHCVACPDGFVMTSDGMHMHAYQVLALQAK